MKNMEGGSKPLGQLIGVALLCVTVWSSVASSVHGAVVSLQWTVDYSFLSPDCFEKRVLTINGAYPGPTINATVGDQIVIAVTNALDDKGTSIHWHGIRQAGTPFYDGVGGETQCPILPGETFTYNFTVDRSGTYWYHGHYASQRSEGLYGALVVRPAIAATEDAGLGEELEPLLLNDWWHGDWGTLLAGLDQPMFRWIGNPQSILVNGRGVFNCSSLPVDPTITCNTTVDSCGPTVLTVQPNKVYRLRLVSVTTLFFLSFGIQGHNLTVVQADNTLTEPVTVSRLDMDAGQSYSVLLNTSQMVDNYVINVYIRHRDQKGAPVGVALLKYEGAPALSADQLRALAPPPYDGPAWNDTDASLAFARSILSKAGAAPATPSLSAARNITVLGTQNRIMGQLRWAVNNISYMRDDADPGLLGTYLGVNGPVDTRAQDQPPATWDFTQPLVAQGISTEAKFGRLIYGIKSKDTILVVLQNSLALNNVSETHPWHLHGHNFWVVGFGSGNYNASSSPATFNLANPIFRHTVTLFPKSWTAIAFVADNPGFWFFHCHVEPHFHMGMGLAFDESPADIPPLPANFPLCSPKNSSLSLSSTKSGVAGLAPAAWVGLSALGLSVLAL